MKTNLKLLLGLIILVSMTTSVYAGVLPVKTTHNMMLSKAKLKTLNQTDTYTYAFVYDTYDYGGGYYSVKVYLVLYDETAHSYTSATAPSDISITVPSGLPGAGTYTFPSGASSQEYGEFDFGTTPPNTIPVTTSPTSISGTPIYQDLVNIYYADTFL